VLNGQVLSPEDLDRIRRDLEALDGIEAISPQLRGIVIRNWPHLVAKLPPEDDE
jgi:hypothetical protein